MNRNNRRTATPFHREHNNISNSRLTLQQRRNEPPPRLRITQGHPAMTEMDINLLQLRKRYKNLSLSYINLQTQANFLTACLDLNITPVGFRIRIKCMTPKKGMTDVQSTFDQHVSKSEQGLARIIRDHLQTSSTLLQTEIMSTLGELNSTSNSASLSEMLGHTRYQQATVRNLDKEAKWKSRLATNKLLFLKGKDHRQMDGEVTTLRREHRVQPVPNISTISSTREQQQQTGTNINNTTMDQQQQIRPTRPDHHQPPKVP